MILENKLWMYSLEVFFQQNVLLHENPRIINYYLKTFLRFIECNLDYINEDAWDIICDKVQNKLIPTMINSDENYSERVTLLFEVLGLLCDSKFRPLESRIKAIK